jgi:LPXTG-motif cell wall-anchored protein
MLKGAGILVLTLGMAVAAYAAPPPPSPSWWGPPPPPPPPPWVHRAPEIDPASALAGLTLLVGGLAVIRGRRKEK